MPVKHEPCRNRMVCTNGGYIYNCHTPSLHVGGRDLPTGQAGIAQGWLSPLCFHQPATILMHPT